MEAPLAREPSRVPALEAHLLGDPTLEECVVLEREGPDSSSERIAYVVVPAAEDPERLLERLADDHQAQITAFVPIWRLPVTDRGAVDLGALARIPVRERQRDADWEAQISGLAAIGRAAAITGPWRGAERRLHRTELFRSGPGAAPASRSEEQQAAGSTPAAAVSEPEAPPALCHGGPLPERAGEAWVLGKVLHAAPADSVIVYVGPDGAERVETYGSQLADAERILGGLRQLGLAPGDRVVFQLERPEDIIPLLWASMLGGFEGIIVPCPVSYGEESRALAQLGHVVELFDRSTLVTDRARVEDLRSGARGSQLARARVAVLEELREGPRDSRQHDASPDDVALYALSSGSTGVPKAIALTHRNLLARARGHNVEGYAAGNVVLNWLPFDHIGSISHGHLTPALLGCKLIYAPKEYILGRPLRLLDLIDRHRVTHTWAPNFSYALVSTALERERAAQWDLSCAQMLLNAGELITAVAVRRFTSDLARFGLRPSAVQSAFGMAELCSGVTSHQPPEGSSIRFHHIDRGSVGGAVRYVDPSDPAGVSFASLGAVIPGVSMRIVDADRQVLPERVCGRLQFQGAALSPGYYRNPEANQAFGDDGWFDTGDMGFIADGELVLTGRADAGIIINGANFSNSEIEAVVEGVDGVIASFAAACAVRPPDSAEQKLAVFFHPASQDEALLPGLLGAIQARLTKQLGVKADYLLPLDRSAIPKTEIGKIQRKKLAEQFNRGEHDALVRRVDLRMGNQNTVPDCFYREAWQRKDLVHAARPRGGATLVLADAHGLGERVAEELRRRDMPCVIVTEGGSFAQRGPSALEMRVGEPEDHRALLQWLEEVGVQVGTIVHLLLHERASDGSETSFTRELTRGPGSLFLLAQALQARGEPREPVRLLAVSSHSQAILAGDQVAVARSSLPGLLDAIGRDLPWLRCAHVDIPGPERQSAAEQGAVVVAEILGSSADGRVAYREGQRWVRGLRRVATAAETRRELPLRKGGTYVVHGNLAGAGWIDALLAPYEARLLRGGRELRDALGSYEGVIDGFIHVAELPAGRPLSEETWERVMAMLDREVTAVWSLAQLALERESALFITLAAPAEGAWALGAASSFQDGLIAQLERRGRSAHAIRLDGPQASERAAADLVLGALHVGGRVIVGADGDAPRLRAQALGESSEVERTKLFVSALDGTPSEHLRNIEFVDRYGTPAPCDVVLMREPDHAAVEQVELWPSIAEYFVYDDLIYYALANDERRNRSYRVALGKTVRDKVVLDIGTGKEAILARLAVEAGARKVYAIEMGDEAFEAAVAHVKRLGLDDRITIIHGDATEVTLPEPADVCVSEIVGPIGGCEGAAAIINNAHRFLGPGGVMIPGHAVTRIAAVQFPDALRHLGFHQVPGTYAERIFEQVGYPFDLRVCLKNFPRGNVLSSPGVFEDLDFSRPIPLEHEHKIELRFEKGARFDGFLVWLNLHTIEGETIDILEHEFSWLPVYMPVFDPGLEVSAGDRIEATITRTLCENALNPDYVISGSLIRGSGERVPFTHASYHYRKRYRQHPFYERLFRDDPIGRNPSCRPGSPLRHLPELPLLPSGAPDRERLRALARGGQRQASSGQSPTSAIELQIAEIWKDVLGLDAVDVNDSFFELGGHSLLLVQAQDRLAALFGPKVTLVDLFKFPTIKALAGFLGEGQPRETASGRGRARAEIRSRRRSASGGEGGDGIAVIGMACRFPGADDLQTFWRNLSEGRESLSLFTEEEVLAAGIDPTSVKHPGYVKANPTLADVERFDAEFFGLTAREADLMDPQHRIFLECAWEAFEIAGYDPLAHRGPVGVYAGASMNTYLINNILPNRDTLDANDDLSVFTLDSMGGFQLMVAADKDYLPTRVSYKLNLTGPSINVQTACSTALVAIHMASQAILAGECDMALAGGASVKAPQQAGHLYQEGMIVSPDGHCRAFDAQARGTVFGSGAGVVLLKRLADAIRDRDPIFAVIKGSAVNNDGGTKVGYMAPSGDGQAAVVAEAMAMANISPDTVTFVEAHGTGTQIGDPIEISGLTEAFRRGTDRAGYCAVGSVKTNVGHMQIASGAAGFIKAALALHHQVIPPTLHFERPNPAIDFASSPFFVNTQALPWKSEGPRRAGVNSLGIGGTNAHVILEEAPLPAATGDEVARSTHVLSLSARSPEALRDLVARYQTFLGGRGEEALVDICYTSNVGRSPFEHRLAVAAGSMEALREGLAAWSPERTAPRPARGPKILFLFSGQGSQQEGMGRILFETQPVFRAALERCHDLLRGRLGVGLLDVLYPRAGGASLIDRTEYTQPALFAFEYALYQMWRSFGVEPAAVLGHSVGEYVAACVAGVFSLEDGLDLIAERARVMAKQPGAGAMAAVFASEREVAARLEPHRQRASVAAVNGPASTVISGDAAAIQAVLDELAAAGVRHQVLRVSHAFHSPLMDGARTPLERFAARMELLPPKILFLSNLTGKAEDREFTEPSYWARHLREPVRFADGVEAASQAGCDHFVELGPRPSLLGMASTVLGAGAMVSLPTLRPGEDDWKTVAEAVARLYEAGQVVDWERFHEGTTRRRVVLPTYPFQRKRHWIDAPAAQKPARALRAPGGAASWLQAVPLSPLIPHVLFEGRLSVRSAPLLADHVVFEQVVVSGATHVAMVIDAVTRHFGAEVCELEDVVFARALVIPEGGDVRVQLVLEPRGEDRYTFRLISLNGEQPDSWTGHVEGVVVARPEPLIRAIPLDEVRRRCTEDASAGDLFRVLHERRHIYLGESYRWVSSIQRGHDEALSRIEVLPKVSEGWAGPLHPGLIDTCFCLMLACGDLESDRTQVPFQVARIRARRMPAGRPLHVHARLHAPPGDALVGSMNLLDDEGRPVLEIERLQAREVARSAFVPSASVNARDLLYELIWEPAETGANGDRSVARGSWIVLGGEGPTGGELAARIRAQGQRCYLITPRAGEHGAEQRGVDPLDAQGFTDLLRSIEGPVVGVVHLWAEGPVAAVELGLDTLTAVEERACGGLLHLVQAMRRVGWERMPRLWIATRGAQPVGSGPVRAEQAPVWGLGRALSMEQPDLRCVRVDLDPEADEQAERLLGEIAHPGDENEIAWRAGRRYVHRLARSRARGSREGVAIDPHATYLVTGGLGALGRRVAGWLCEQGARHLVLTGRRLPEQPLPDLEQLSARGCKVRIVAADVSQPGQVSDLIRQAQADGPPLKGVLHLAGSLDDGVLVQQSWERFRRVMAPKVDGTLNLHHATADIALDFFVCFSSIASILGSAGQGNYAAASAFQDALCHLRRATGRPGLSVNWGPWAGSGMAASISARDRERIAAQGLQSIEPDVALAALDALLGDAAAQQVVLAVDWPAFQRSAPGGALPSLVRSFVSREAAPARRAWMREELEATPVATRTLVLQKLIRAEAVKVLGGMSAEAFSDAQPLHELGLDSLQAIDLQNRFASSLGTTLPFTLVFDNPTIQHITEYLTATLSDLFIQPPAPKEEPAQRSGSMNELESLSDEDLLGLLAEELESAEPRRAGGRNDLD
uniref:Polyketide synthase n=1 Tax=Jahnella sp. MSr9139 TaxID=1434086 RepID=V5UVT6_9BACT|nr:polyketide synthase [Jahnella sp. MSr9139]